MAVGPVVVRRQDAALRSTWALDRGRDRAEDARLCVELQRPCQHMRGDATDHAPLHHVDRSVLLHAGSVAPALQYRHGNHDGSVLHVSPRTRVPAVIRPEEDRRGLL